MRKALRYLLAKSPGAGTIGLASVSLCYVFFMIVPFFLLGIYGVHVGGYAPSDAYRLQRVDYEHAFGVSASVVVGIVFVLISQLAPVLWLLSFVDFVKRRKWYVLAILLLAPLPIAYVNAGHYSCEISNWVFPLD